jgi:hypothetical protein
MERCEAGDPGSENQRKVFYWCLHCERAHSAEAWDRNDGGCPYPGCDGSAWDRWPWRRLRAVNGYSRVPELGAYYPLYPDK